MSINSDKHDRDEKNGVNVRNHTVEARPSESVALFSGAESAEVLHDNSEVYCKTGWASRETFASKLTSAVLGTTSARSSITMRPAGDPPIETSK